MFAVALCRWSETFVIEDEVRALAPLMGKSAYDARLVLQAPPPIVLLSTPELAAAQRGLALLRGRGHGAVACDLARVRSSSDFFAPKTFRFEPAELVIATPAAEQRLPYADVLALIRARHDSTDERVCEQRSTKFSLARAAMTGGLAVTKTTVRHERRVSEAREQVLYVFSRSGDGHVFLRESRLVYAGLGDRLGPTTAENFAATVALLRERAPSALFDERLVSRRRRGDVLSAGAGGSATSNAGETDLLAHLLAVAQLQGQL